MKNRKKCAEYDAIKNVHNWYFPVHFYREASTLRIIERISEHFSIEAHENIDIPSSQFHRIICRPLVATSAFVVFFFLPSSQNGENFSWLLSPFLGFIGIFSSYFHIQYDVPLRVGWKNPVCWLLIRFRRFFLFKMKLREIFICFGLRWQPFWQ